MKELITVQTSGDDLGKCIHSLQFVVKEAIDNWRSFNDAENSDRYLFDLHQFQTLAEMIPVLSSVPQGAVRYNYRVIAVIVVKERTRWQGQ